MGEREPTHFAYINALRGWAILGVIAVHTSQQFSFLEQPYLRIATDGQHGVQLFFVVSALTLMLSWHSRNDGVVPFYIRRLFRIGPMFWLAIPLFLVLHGFSSRYWAPGGISWWHVALTATFMHGWHPVTINSVVPGGWSIAVEMTFYAVFPLLVLFCSSLRRTLLMLFAALVLMHVMRHFASLLYVPDDTLQPQKLLDWFARLWFWSQLPVFIVGLGTYFAVEAIRQSPHKGLALLLVSVAVMVAVCLDDRARLMEPVLPRHILFGLGFGLLATGLSAWPTRALVNHALCFMGQVSFSAYLWHFALLEVLSRFGFPAAIYSSKPVWPFFFAYLLGVTAITILLSAITYRLVERPMIRVGSSVARGFAGRSYSGKHRSAAGGRTA